MAKEDNLENQIPTRLKKEPLLEALWEVRFIGTMPSIADVLPGMLFKALSHKYENIVRLPVADIPEPIVKDNLTLLYLPKVRLENGNQAVQIGEHAVSLSCRRPYSGWEKFSRDIRELTEALQETGLIKTLERFALKYINLIELDQQPASKCLNLDWKLGGQEINTSPISFRIDISQAKLIHAIKIVSPAEAFLPDSEERHRGILLDIDTIRNLHGESDWEDLEEGLDPAHMASKKMFFSLLSEETVHNLGPKYEE